MVWKSEPPFPAVALTRTSYPVSEEACDTHAHVFGPAPGFPSAADARYSHPPEADAARYAEVRLRLGLRRGVLVQPSYYRFDNQCLLHALDGAPSDLRGVAMIDPFAPAPDLAGWHRRGVRGLRVDLFREQALGRGLDDMRKSIDRLASLAAPLGWSLDLYAPGTLVGALVEHLAALPVAASIAHMGYMHPGTEEAAMFGATVARAAASSNLWIKLTGTYRLAPAREQRGVDEMAKALVAVMPQRLLWGSDWPHVLADPVDTGALLQRLYDWCPDERVRNGILAENPARLYWRE